MESVDDGDDVDKVERARKGAWKAAAIDAANKRKKEIRLIIVAILVDKVDAHSLTGTRETREIERHGGDDESVVSPSWIISRSGEECRQRLQHQWNLESKNDTKKNTINKILPGRTNAFVFFCFHSNHRKT
jgi:hypothetical protein